MPFADPNTFATCYGSHPSGKNSCSSAQVWFRLTLRALMMNAGPEHTASCHDEAEVMTRYTPWNLPTRFGINTRRLLALGVLIILGLGPIVAAPPWAGQSPASAQTDIELALKIRSALARDPMLKHATPVVSVVDRIAVVGGPVPSEEAGRRLKELVQETTGLAGSRISVWAEPTDDPLKTLVSERIKAGVQPVAQAQPSDLRPELGPLPYVTLDPRVSGRIVAQRAEPTAGMLLLDPVSPRASANPRQPLPASPTGKAQYPTIPAPSVPVNPEQNDLELAVEAARSKDPRFSRLKVAVQNDQLTISGQAQDGVAWDLVAELRKVPGVRRVNLGVISGLESRSISQD